jgi:hypothetical protein
MEDKFNTGETRYQDKVGQEIPPADTEEQPTLSDLNGSKDTNEDTTLAEAAAPAKAKRA